MIFVTGGSGLVGSHLLMDLLKEGQEVKALCRSASDLDRVRKLFTWYGREFGLLNDKIQWVYGDLNDLTSLELAFDGVTEVYHCGGLISFDPRDEEKLIKINQEGTRNIVNLCLDRGVSALHYVSSIATGGAHGRLSEKDSWDPSQTNIYATSKYLGEMEVWRGCAEGLQTIMVNPGVIFGPGFWQSGSGVFFSRVASGLKYCPPGGTGFVGVWDVIRSLRELRDMGCYNERFILVAENLSYQQLLRQISGLLGVSAPTSILSGWQLELLWRLDWIRTLLGSSHRRLSKAIARSLQEPADYRSDKIEKRLGFEFQSMDEVLAKCAVNFRGLKHDQS